MYTEIYPNPVKSRVIYYDTYDSKANIYYNITYDSKANIYYDITYDNKANIYYDITYDSKANIYYHITCAYVYYVVILLYCVISLISLQLLLCRH